MDTEKIISSINGEKNVIKQQMLLTQLLLNLSLEIPITESLADDVKNLIEAIKNNQIGDNMLRVNKSGKDSYLLIGSEDKEHDYDPPYIARVQREAKAFAEVTKLLVKVVDESDIMDLSWKYGPHHVVLLDNLLEQIREYLPENCKVIFASCEQKIEAINSDLKKMKKDKEEKEKREKINLLKEKVRQETTLKISDQIANLLLELQVHNQQDVGFASIGNLLVMSQLTWNSPFNKPGYCTSSKVTDYTVRVAHVIDVERATIIKRDRSERLFRTTDDGVCGKRYEVQIKKVTCENNIVKIVFVDGSELGIAL